MSQLKYARARVTLRIAISNVCNSEHHPPPTNMARFKLKIVRLFLNLSFILRIFWHRLKQSSNLNVNSLETIQVRDQED